MSIKKFMCKHFHEEGSNNVTAGSIIDTLAGLAASAMLCIVVLFIAWAVTIFFLLGVGLSNSNKIPIIGFEIHTIPDSIIAVLTTWVLIAMMGCIVAAVITLYEISHTIEIVKCERKN